MPSANNVFGKEREASNCKSPFFVQILFYSYCIVNGIVIVSISRYCYRFGYEVGSMLRIFYIRYLWFRMFSI